LAGETVNADNKKTRVGQIMYQYCYFHTLGIYSGDRKEGNAEMTEAENVEFEICQFHPDHRKRLLCRRFNIRICDHPECAKCVQPYSLCDYRDDCEVWNFVPEKQK